MELFPRQHKEVTVACDAPRLTQEVAGELGRNGFTVAHHLPGLRVIAHVLRPTSLSLGQEVRLEVRTLGDGKSAAILDSRYHVPGVDLTHQNQRNLELLEGFVREAEKRCSTVTA